MPQLWDKNPNRFLETQKIAYLPINQERGKNSLSSGF